MMRNNSFDKLLEGFRADPVDTFVGVSVGAVSCADAITRSS